MHVDECLALPRAESGQFSLHKVRFIRDPGRLRVEGGQRVARQATQVLVGSFGGNGSILQAGLEHGEEIVLVLLVVGHDNRSHVSL